ncbi:DUF2971 domain-containing protein [Mesorhizobium opportunistum]|nr:DUF2971 domain-containing protein [Mesorhizobium opportunistum]
MDREMGALRDSYLFSPPFAAMNDPMEAFYETGSPGDRIVNAMFATAGLNIDSMYELLSETINRFALVSFSETYENLPMWAYYSSNFAGMCLEFDTADLTIGDFQGEKLCPVTYAHNALPSLTIADMGAQQLEEAVIACITRKRSEWAHEKEWRFVTGQVGPKHFLDDALRRVFLGPRVKPEHAALVCEVMDRRPVEVLQGEIRGFELVFRSIKPARPPGECERVGIGKFDPVEDLFAEAELKQFLTVPFEALLEECHRTVSRPNMEGLAGIDLAGSDKHAIYFCTTYKLRSGREVFHRRYFDRQLRLIVGAD